MKLLKALSLFAALALLGGAVLDAQTGLIRTTLGASPDAGKKEVYFNATKAAPLIHRPPPQQIEANKDAGK